MKNLRTMLAFTLLLFSTLPATADDERTVAFEAQKMTCATCPITVRATMRRVDGDKTVTVDFESKTAIVTYDPSVASASEIAAASSNVGFPTTVKIEDGV